MSRRFRIALSVLGTVALFSACGFAQQPSAPGASGATHLAQAAAGDADGYIKNVDYLALARAVAAMPESPTRDYYAGVLANREGHIAESISLLTKLLPQLEASQPGRTAVALSSLADDYMKSFRYRDANQAYEELLHKFASQMDKQERQSTDDDYRVAVLLKNAPPQAISFNGVVDVTTHRNPVIDTIETTLTVNGVTQSWILDTGANLSTVSASFAHKLGVQPSKGTAQTQGITGAENKLHVAIVPELKLGNATVRNVVLLVLPDKNLNVPTGEKTHSQIDAILGYPVMQALERMTFTSDGHFLGGPDSPSSENGARLYMEELTPLLECDVEGRKVLFSFDSGANGSAFSDRYYREFPAQFNGLKKKEHKMGGAGGIMKTQAYFLPQAQLGVGATQVALHDVPVLPVLGTDQDKFYGNLGRDLVDGYRSFTIDFANMRFLIGEKLPAKPQPK